jgi:hypothetical protein
LSNFEDYGKKQHSENAVFTAKLTEKIPLPPAEGQMRKNILFVTLGS